MANDSSNIGIYVLGRVYPIRVQTKQDEEEARKIEAEIKETLAEFAKVYSYRDEHDLLAMAVIQFATKAMYFEQEAKNISADIKKKITDIGNLIDTNVL